MKKRKLAQYGIAAGLALVAVALLVGAKAFAGTRPSQTDGVIEVREKLFIAQTNEIYLNTEDYMGKTIKLEGLFKSEYYGEDEPPYHYVLRYGPGCCGYDGTAGFEVAWVPRSQEDRAVYPQEDDWVEAVGTLSSYEEEGYPYLYLQLNSLTIKEERGLEFVQH